jgi:hypothetical protein
MGLRLIGRRALRVKTLAIIPAGIPEESSTRPKQSPILLPTFVLQNIPLSIVLLRCSNLLLW